MNAPHVLAWLTCLALAFFACLLAVHNMGATARLERDMAHLKQNPPSPAPNAEELERIRRSLDAIRQELRELKPVVPEEASGRIEELQRRVKDLAERLGEPQAGDSP
jgi:hypothetical protein